MARIWTLGFIWLTAPTHISSWHHCWHHGLWSEWYVQRGVGTTLGTSHWYMVTCSRAGVHYKTVVLNLSWIGAHFSKSFVTDPSDHLTKATKRLPTNTVFLFIGITMETNFSRLREKLNDILTEAHECLPRPSRDSFLEWAAELGSLIKWDPGLKSREGHKNDGLRLEPW